jgi:hypothetical protein
MRVRARVSWAPKAGNSEEEYEDAFWPTRNLDVRVRGFRCAVADGATESSFAGLWARLLVHAYCRRQLDGKRRDRMLARLGGEWRAQASSGPLPWYAEQKLEQGSFSSLLGLRVDEGGRWSALAVGDTCLFHLRREHICCAFPLQVSSEFNNSPTLIASSVGRNRGLDHCMHHVAGDWQRGDAFLLMTDAIACWYLRCIEAGSRPTIPRRLTSFGPWLSALRRDGSVRNDDTTIVRVEML